MQNVYLRQALKLKWFVSKTVWRRSNEFRRVTCQNANIKINIKICKLELNMVSIQAWIKFFLNEICYNFGTLGKYGSQLISPLNCGSLLFSYLLEDVHYEGMWTRSPTKMMYFRSVLTLKILPKVNNFLSQTNSKSHTNEQDLFYFEICRYLIMS